MAADEEGSAPRGPGRPKGSGNFEAAVVTVRLYQGDLDRLSRHCDRLGKSQAQLLRDGIRRHLDRLDEQG